MTAPAMAQFSARVAANVALTGGYFRLDLEAEPAAPGAAGPVAGARAGQFVMLRGDWGRDLINGRAFSLLEAPEGHRFSVLAKVFGRGTALLERARVGEAMTVTGPLGTPFPAPTRATRRLLVAGGVGLPPLHLYARQAVAAGLGDVVEMFYGGRSADDLVLVDDLEAWGVGHTLASEDGSRGFRGRVTEPLGERLELARVRGEQVSILACGPTPMLRAVRALALQRGVEAHLCLEEHMACGFGVCLGCAVPVYGRLPYKYCCTDGPVFDAREVRWP